MKMVHTVLLEPPMATLCINRSHEQGRGRPELANAAQGNSHWLGQDFAPQLIVHRSSRKRLASLSHTQDMPCRLTTHLRGAMLLFCWDKWDGQWVGAPDVWWEDTWPLLPSLTLKVEKLFLTIVQPPFVSKASAKHCKTGLPQMNMRF